MATDKIKTREELISIVEGCKKSGKKVGFTSGVFDLLHPGHVQYLEDSRKLCDLLIVGLNSDSSVKKYKSLSRPIVEQTARAKVVAGLTSVDYVFVFDEVNNNKNVEILKPDLYIKAGDYPLEKLSSKPLVESYGGSVTTVPLKEGYSTTAIIKSIAQEYGEQHSAPLPVHYERKPALFLDRDGTIIEHVEYLHEVAKIKLIPGAIDGMKKAQELGYRIIWVTNQPGIGLGYFTKEDLFRVNKAILKAVSDAGVMVDKIYYCPHSKSDGCPCRKPATALLIRAQEELNIDLKNSFVVGDMTSDIELGSRAGCKTVLVKTGSGGTDGLYATKANFEISSLAEIATILPPAPVSSGSGDGKPTPLYDGELQTVGYVTGKLGHDFNNLFGTLLGGIDIIKGRAQKAFPQDNPFEKALTLMSTAIVKGVDLTSRIRAYARPSILDVAPTSLLATIEDATAQFKKVHGEGAHITVSAFDDVKVEANQFTLSRILVSLFENSLQAFKKDGSKEIRVTVHCDPKRGKALITVTDEGKGMSSEELEKFLTPFRSSKSGVGIGYGASLAMARINLRKMRGALSIQSEREKGTSVTVEVLIAQ